MLLCNTGHLYTSALSGRPACRVLEVARLTVSLLCRLNLRPVMSNEAVCQVGTLMTLLNGCLLKSVNANETLDGAHYERIFLYCLAWAVGGLLDVKDRPAFDTELRTLSQAVPPKASCSTHADGSHALPASASNAHTPATAGPQHKLLHACFGSSRSACKGITSVDLPPRRFYVMASGGTVMLEPALPGAPHSLHFTQSAAGCLHRSCLVCVQALHIVRLQTEDTDTIFEFLVRDDNAQWQHWKECVPSWEYPKKQERPKFAQLVIPTLDSVRYEKLLMLCYSVQKVSC